ncbi:MAG: polysaccharide export protein [Magnetococcales bacterium]|nr:polysaccharide export protein [Magnetococcales bacterium]
MLLAFTPSRGFSAESNYRLGVGDTVAIKVFDEPDLSITTRLGDSTAISYPLLGEIQVKNMTVRQLEEFISSRLRDDYLVNPRVRVSIEEYRKFYVKGEVKAPGGYPYSPELTLDRVISLAGGFTNRANKSRILILSEQSKSKKPRSASLDSRIQPGDVITVQRRFF